MINISLSRLLELAGKSLLLEAMSEKQAKDIFAYYGADLSNGVNLARKQLMMKYHPDREAGNNNAAQEINAAYDVLRTTKAAKKPTVPSGGKEFIICDIFKGILRVDPSDPDDIEDGVGATYQMLNKALEAAYAVNGKQSDFDIVSRLVSEYLGISDRQWKGGLKDGKVYDIFRFDDVNDLLRVILNDDQK